MDTKQIDLVKNIIYLFSFISLIVQLIIFKNFNDFICILVIFFQIFYNFYCLNNNYFLNTVSLLIIFISHFQNLGGAIFFKSVEFTLVTDKLDLPFSTIFILTVININYFEPHLIPKN